MAGRRILDRGCLSCQAEAGWTPRAGGAGTGPLRRDPAPGGAAPGRGVRVGPDRGQRDRRQQRGGLRLRGAVRGAEAFTRRTRASRACSSASGPRAPGRGGPGGGRARAGARAGRLAAGTGLGARSPGEGPRRAVSPGVAPGGRSPEAARAAVLRARACGEARPRARADAASPSKTGVVRGGPPLRRVWTGRGFARRAPDRPGAGSERASGGHTGARAQAACGGLSSMSSFAFFSQSRRASSGRAR